MTPVPQQPSSEPSPGALRGLAAQMQRNPLGFGNLSPKQLAARWKVSTSWILDNSKPNLCADPIPFLTLGKFKRFCWGSPELTAWIERHLFPRSRSVGSVDPADYEFLDSAEFAARLNISESWVRDQVRSRAEDPIPCVRFGKYVRFRWGSPELETWAERRMLIPNNRTVGRAQRKETVQ